MRVPVSRTRTRAARELLLGSQDRGKGLVSPHPELKPDSWLVSVLRSVPTSRGTGIGAIASDLGLRP